MIFIDRSPHIWFIQPDMQAIFIAGANECGLVAEVVPQEGGRVHLPGAPMIIFDGNIAVELKPRKGMDHKAFTDARNQFELNIVHLPDPITKSQIPDHSDINIPVA